MYNTGTLSHNFPFQHTIIGQTPFTMSNINNNENIFKTPLPVKTQKYIKRASNSIETTKSKKRKFATIVLPKKMTTATKTTKSTDIELRKLLEEPIRSVVIRIKTEEVPIQTNNNQQTIKLQSTCNRSNYSQDLLESFKIHPNKTCSIQTNVQQLNTYDHQEVFINTDNFINYQHNIPLYFYDFSDCLFNIDFQFN
jgi:hypothetical protein